MARRTLRSLALLGALLALGGGSFAAEEAKKPLPAPRGFYRAFLAPNMASRLNPEVAAATQFADSAANPWTRDAGTVARIQKSAERAALSATKQYLIHELSLDTWSISLSRKAGIGSPTKRTDGVGLRFGIARLAPRAELLIPSAAGRATLSLDARGRMATSFEATDASFTVGVTFDAPTRSGWFSLGRRF